MYAAKHAIERHISTQASSGGNGSSRGITKDSDGVQGIIQKSVQKRKEKELWNMQVAEMQYYNYYWSHHRALLVVV